jgi:hypothetical protein
MIKIRINETTKPMMINEALQGLQLPDILNTKVLESVTINPKAQETFGRFVRDWMLNWGMWSLSAVAKTINFNTNDSKKFLRPVFFRLYRAGGGNPNDLMARKDYYGFTTKAWDERLESIDLSNIKKTAKWKDSLIKALGPGQGNDVDHWILDKTIDDFIDMKKFMQQQAMRFYTITNSGLEINFSHMWPKMRKVLKSIRRYFAKRDIPMVYDAVEHEYNIKLLNSYLIMYRNRTVVKLIKYLNENEKNWVDIEKILKEPGMLEGDSWDAIGDFLEKAKYRRAYDKMCSSVGDGEIAPTGVPCIIKKYDDGFFWFSRGRQSCSLFGEEGRNCGNGDFTLIDLQNKVTRGNQSKRSWHIGLDYDVDDRILHQVLGWGNSFPTRKYIPYIKDFIETYDVSDIHPTVFEFLQGKDDVTQEQIYEFVFAVANKSVKDNWETRRKDEEEAGPDPEFDENGRLVENQDKDCDLFVNKSKVRWRKNLAMKLPVAIDSKQAHAVRSWYKNKRNRRK